MTRWQRAVQEGTQPNVLDYVLFVATILALGVFIGWFAFWLID